MAINIKMKSPLEFFEKLVAATGGGGDSLLENVSLLENAFQVNFSFSFMDISAKTQSGPLSDGMTMTLPVSVTSIMKGTAPAAVALMARMHVQTFINTLLEKMAPVASNSLKAFSKAVEDALAKKAVASSDMEARVKLKEAVAINQPVFGSDTTSMYRVIGVGDVNLAARVQGVVLSIRAEGTFNPLAKQELLAMGLKANKGYMSAHFNVEDVPPHRIMGAVLYAKGLNLSKRIEDVEDLKGGA